MEVDKTLNVPITVDRNSTQVSHVHMVCKVSKDKSMFFVFQSEDFFGHGVTAGFRLDSLRDVMSLYFKVAICAPNDTYDKALGEEIVLGRLLKADKDKPRLALEVSQLSDDELSKAITQSVVSFLSTFGEVLVVRDKQLDILNLMFDEEMYEFREKLDKFL